MTALPPVPRLRAPLEGEHVWQDVAADAKVELCHRCSAAVFRVGVGSSSFRVSCDVPGGLAPNAGQGGRGKVHIVVCRGRA